MKEKPAETSSTSETSRSSETSTQSLLSRLTGETTSCKTELTAPDKHMTLQVWQMLIQLAYPDPFLGREQNISMELLGPNFIHVPYEVDKDKMPIQPGSDYGVLHSPSTRENGCFPESAIKAITGIMKVGPCV